MKLNVMIIMKMWLEYIFNQKTCINVANNLFIKQCYLARIKGTRLTKKKKHAVEENDYSISEN